MLIAICDDDQKSIEELERRTRNYFSVHAGITDNLEIYTFQSGSDLLQSFAHRKYEIIFLDIDMPEIKGIDLASRIRLIDKYVQITFVTYMEDQLPFGYRVMASGFVVKPFTQERINSVINDMMALINAGRIPPIEIKLKGGGTTCLEARDIVFIESFRHYMEAVTKDRRRYEFLGNLSYLEAELREYYFVRLHRSYLVNMAYIFIRNTDSVRLTCGQELPVGRSYAEKFNTLYEKYRRENG